MPIEPTLWLEIGPVLWYDKKEENVIPEGWSWIQMNTNWKTAVTIGLAAAGVGAIYGALYCRAMHPHIPKPEQGKKRIVCVGDSLTYGWGLMGAFQKYAYPAVLQEKLGNEYQVMNFGICDRTLRDGADRPYRQEKIYAASLASAPDTVIILLGTNDAKPGNFDAAGYRNDLRSYISVYRNLPSKPDLILMQPPRVFRILGMVLGGIRDQVISGEIHEIIDEIGQETGCTVIDLYALTEQHRGWFVDGIHLNRQGTEAVAEAVLKVIGNRNAFDAY